MAKDDYLSIVYKLLQILYEDLKAGEKTCLKDIMNDSDTFPVGHDYWIAIFEDLLDKGYIKNVEIMGIANSGKKKIAENRAGIRITMDGVEYLENNGSMKKMRDVWGVVKDFLPLANSLLIK